MAAILDVWPRAAPKRKVALMSKSPDKDTSLTLMMRVQQNPADPRAWDDFVERYQPMIRAWCVRWGSQACDANDVTQQVLLKLLTAMKEFRHEPGSGFRGWLKTVTHNAWLDFARRPKNGQGAAGLDAIADSSDALADLEKEMQQAFERESPGAGDAPGRRARQAEHLASLPAHVDRKPQRRRGRRTTQCAGVIGFRRQASSIEAS